MSGRTALWCSAVMGAISLIMVAGMIRVLHVVPQVPDLYHLVYGPDRHKAEGTRLFLMPFPLACAYISVAAPFQMWRKGEQWVSEGNTYRLAIPFVVFTVLASAAAVRLIAVERHFGI